MLSGGSSPFHSNFKRTFCRAKSGDPDQTPRYVAPDLSLRCLPMFHKKYARHIRVDIFKLNLLSYPYIIGQVHFLF